MSYKVCRFIYCNRVFWPYRKAHKFCCRSCQRRSAKMRQSKTPFERNCSYEECSKPFRPYHNQKFCSRVCALRYYRNKDPQKRLDYQRKYYLDNRDRIVRQKREKRNRDRAA